MQPPQQEAQEDALAEEQEAIKRQAGTAIGGASINGARVGGVRGRFSQQQCTPIQGIQPLGPNQKNLNQRRALTPRDQQRRLSRFGQPPDQPQQEGNQDN